MFGNLIDITDPCYDRDVWCRLNNVEISEGCYSCVIWIEDDKEFGESVRIIGIYKDGQIPYSEDMEAIGFIGVDAGLAGFFENKPDYKDEEWLEFCDSIKEGNAWIKKEGFFSSSGYGDGEYDVKAFYKEGKITALEIYF